MEILIMIGSLPFNNNPDTAGKLLGYQTEMSVKRLKQSAGILAAAFQFQSKLIFKH